MKNDHPFIHRIPIKDREGRVTGHREVVAYHGLLDLVHKERLSLIRTELLQAPHVDNGQTAIVRATIRTSRGTFTGIGDANPGNVNPRIAPHLVRMAETRAEARAMRKAVNIGTVSFEELAEDPTDDAPVEGEPPPVQVRVSAAQDASTPASAAFHVPASSGNGNGRSRESASTVTDSQRRYLFRLLCERGLRNDEARDFLHRELGVASLEQASKETVSALIDRLKRSNGYVQNREPGDEDDHE